ncbi:MAG: stage 0 sporulation family protein [Clostridia bacterium]|nr:stage 0 sporulation family protein [Clostridia bacterium]
MESWFSNAAVESRADTDFLGEKSSALRDNEPLPQVELDLNDILPPIALEKYSREKTEEDAVEEAAADTSAEDVEETVEVIGVRFNKTGKIYYFAPNGNTARRGDAVIVETARGLEFGEAWLPNRTVPTSEIVPPLRPVIRLADDKDKTHNADNRKREEDAFRICLEKIKAHGLDMKLVEAQYTFDNTKLLFYFTSAGRVDFRELVKDLASVFRTRIELRQIGIRDEAKLMGGLGICGRPLCCASFLSDFTQVSIKMAKEQNLSLNSAKISGACGRLMCCLNYEYPVYCEAARNTPSVGSTVSTPDGNGTVVEANPLAGTVKVSLANAPADTVPQYYRCDRVRILHEGRKHGNEDPAPAEEDTVQED